MQTTEIALIVFALLMATIGFAWGFIAGYWSHMWAEIDQRFEKQRKQSEQ